MYTRVRLSLLIDTVNERIGKFSAWFILLAVFICTVNALVRYAFNLSSNGWLEIQWYLNSAMFLLVAAYALKLNAHVRIDVIAGKLSQRAQAWIDIFGGLFMLLPAVLIIAWYSWPSLVNSFQIGEMSSDNGGLIRWPVAADPGRLQPAGIAGRVGNHQAGCVSEGADPQSCRTQAGGRLNVARSDGAADVRRPGCAVADRLP